MKKMIATMATLSTLLSASFAYAATNPDYQNYIYKTISESVQEHINDTKYCQLKNRDKCIEDEQEILKKSLEEHLKAELLKKYDLDGHEQVEARSAVQGALIAEGVGMIINVAKEAAAAAADVYKTKKEQEAQKQALAKKAIEGGYYDVWLDATSNLK